jgi:hypothetical protein
MAVNHSVDGQSVATDQRTSCADDLAQKIMT